MSDTPFVVTKKSLGLAGMAAFAACVACCALPVLAAAGIGGGALSAVAGYIRPGADLVVASLVGVGVLAFIASRATRARARALPAANCNVYCDVGGGCGCAPPGNTNVFATGSPRSGEPIVCTADLRDQPTVQGQLDGYRAAFAHLLCTEKVDGAVRWVFANRPGLSGDLRTWRKKSIVAAASSSSTCGLLERRSFGKRRLTKKRPRCWTSSRAYQTAWASIPEGTRSNRSKRRSEEQG